jgi:hypothetical protein
MGPSGNKKTLLRVFFLFLAICSLLLALWTGLLRLGWGLPSLGSGFPLIHGPLMISGFLGTLIGLERAVALGHSLTYTIPFLTGVGALLLVVFPFSPFGPILILAGSLGLSMELLLLSIRQMSLFTLTVLIGAVVWFLGNIIWVAVGSMPKVVLWWLGFLMLTVVGERIELSRLRAVPRLSVLVFLALTVLFLAGLFVSVFNFLLGLHIAGIGMVGLSMWLFRYDISRFAIRFAGLSRYIATCVLSGCIWLGISGLLALCYGRFSSGFQYDALLHSFFLGFVFSMIFGHAPIVFSSVVGKTLPFSRVFYLTLGLLHLSLLFRVLGDLISLVPLRSWGGFLNVICILIFFISTSGAFFYTVKSRKRESLAIQ